MDFHENSAGSGEVRYEYDMDDEEDFDVTEECLDFEPPPLHKHGRVKLSCEIKDLQSEGTKIRSGKWTKREDKLLTENWNKFLAEYEVRSPFTLLGLSQGNRSKIKKFVAAKKFYYKLAKGLSNRTLNSVYLRARKIFDPRRNSEKLSEDEVSKLINLHSLHGNKWTRISKFMNKQPSTCLESYRWNKKNPKKGRWVQEEEQKLTEAIEKVVDNDTLSSSFRGYPWGEISNLIPTRNESQCRKHWLESLCWKTELKKETWSKEDDAVLIYKLYTEMAEKEDYVDWDSLYEHFKSRVPSYVAIQKHFQNLKNKVPDYKSKDFEDIIVFLYRRQLPALLRCIGLELHRIRQIADGKDVISENMN